MADRDAEPRAPDAPLLQRNTWSQLLLADRAADRALVDRLWDDADAMVAEGTPIKPGDRCTIVTITHDGRRCVLKRFNRRGPLHSILHWPLRSRARWCWNSAQLLRAAGLNTPRPLVMLERRFGPLRVRSFILSTFVQGRTLADIIAGDPDEQTLQMIADRFAQVWRALGQWRLGHRDMKDTNFVIDHHGAIWLVDLDAMRRYPPGPWLALRRRKDRARLLDNWPDKPHVQDIFRRAMQRAEHAG